MPFPDLLVKMLGITLKKNQQQGNYDTDESEVEDMNNLSAETELNTDNIKMNDTYYDDKEGEL